MVCKRTRAADADIRGISENRRNQKYVLSAKQFIGLRNKNMKWGMDEDGFYPTDRDGEPTWSCDVADLLLIGALGVGFAALLIRITI